MYTLLRLTHVCRFWRSSLIHYPPVWTTIFATYKDRRSFVEMCLERSQPLLLRVLTDTSEEWPGRTGCNCVMAESKRLNPNEKSPCERHFLFEALAHPKNSERVRVLNMESTTTVSCQVLEFGSCRFFNSPLPQLTTLIWRDYGIEYLGRLSPDPCSLPNLRCLTFEGCWHPSLARVRNLTSFTIKSSIFRLDVENFRLFASNNRSLESLELRIGIKGSTKGPPVELSNLKSLRVESRPVVLSNAIRAPAFQNLSSLWISLEDEDRECYIVCATGDGISLSTKTWGPEIAECWEYLAGYTRPTIRHVRVYDQVEKYGPDGDFLMVIAELMVDAHTLDIGLTYSEDRWFQAKLKQLGPQLKTIRFEISEKMNPIRGPGEQRVPWDSQVLDGIADLIEYRFKMGWALSTVERMVVSEDQQVDRLQDRVWRQFYDSRKIEEYLAPV